MRNKKIRKAKAKKQEVVTADELLVRCMTSPCNKMYLKLGEDNADYVMKVRKKIPYYDAGVEKLLFNVGKVIYLLKNK